MITVMVLFELLIWVGSQGALIRTGDSPNAGIATPLILCVITPSDSYVDIKEVRKRKDRAKELEGIDMSNIVASSRRRSTTSFVPPPRPKIPVESDADDSEDSDADSNSDDENNDGDGDDNDASDGSQSDEVDEDNDEDSD